VSSSPPNPSYFTKEETYIAISKLGKADFIKLQRIAKYCARNCPLDADDLLQEAFKRSFEGKRQWPKQVELIPFLLEVMRSIASTASKANQRNPEQQCFDIETIAERDHSDIGEEIERKQEYEKQIERLMKIFADDEDAQIIIQYLMDGTPRKEICKKLGITEATYASKRRLIRRRVDKDSSKGSDHES
jgi:RNA polymerase sigma factor (sigma-70 family)